MPLRLKKKYGFCGRAFRGMLLAAAMSLVLTTTGCSRLDAAAVQFGLKESPYYHLGDTEWDHGGVEEYYFNQIPSELNEVYRELYARIADYEDSADLYATVPTKDFWTAYYAVMADHPEFFWVGSNISIQESLVTGKTMSYELTALVPKEERDARRVQLEAAADQCIAQIPEGASDYEKIKAVYEYLIDTTEYNAYAPNSQNIQSVLLGHVSVCAGYARAFSYILHRMGMFCTYITGKTNDGADHAWNIVRIDGQYYNVDVTWGDPVFVGGSEGSSAAGSMNYNYLCCSDAELSRTHIAEVSVPLPACTDESYNYYRRNGLYYDSFDTNAIRDALMNSVWSWSPTVVMKFKNAEDYQMACYELFQNGMLQEPTNYLMSQTGTTSWNYSYRTDDDFYLITIFWGI